MKKISKLFASVCLLALMYDVQSQTSVTYTVDVYVDNNNNLIHDLGEPYVNNGYNLVPVRAQSACGGQYSTGTFYGNCPGNKFGGYVLACNGQNYIAEIYEVEKFIQTGITFSNSTIVGSTNSVTNIPLKSSILSKAFFTPVNFQLWNSNSPNNLIGSSIRSGIIADTAVGSICNNTSVSFNTFYGFSVYNLNNCNGLKTILNMKVDNNIIDTYTFTAGATNVYTTVALSTGSLFVQHATTLPYFASFSYSVNNFPALSPGYHSFSIESTPINMPYTQPTVMKSVFYVNDCGQLSGNAYVDCNSNCVKNNPEHYVPNILNINISSNSNTIIAMPDANGNYSVNLPLGTYTINPMPASGYSIVCGSQSVITTVTTMSTFTYNAVLNELSIPPTDFSTYMFLSNANPGPGAVPGGTVTINAYNSRTGSACSPITSPTKLKVVLHPLFSFGNALGTTPAPSAIIPSSTGDTIVWNNPAPIGLHLFTAITATNAVISNSYCMKSIIYPLADGDGGNNNTSNFCGVFGGPYDPNDKISEAPNMSSNGDILPNTQNLEYTIRFQNLGNGKAVNVTISDTISSHLDISTLQILSSSFSVQLQANTVNNLVQFKFPDINLLPATINEPLSHGYVKYKINLKPNLSLGTVIKNQAHIYFDYNSAITTNQTVNTIALPTKINNIHTLSSTKIFPNPTNGKFTVITNESIKSVYVYGITGEFVSEINGLNANTYTIDLSSLAKGLYIVQIRYHNQKTFTTKVIKE